MQNTNKTETPTMAEVIAMGYDDAIALLNEAGDKVLNDIFIGPQDFDTAITMLHRIVRYVAIQQSLEVR